MKSFQQMRGISRIVRRMGVLCLQVVSLIGWWTPQSALAVTPPGTGRVGWRSPAAAGCTSCGDGPSQFTVGIDLEISLGARAEGASAGSLYLSRGAPHLHMFQTRSLEASYDPPQGSDVQVIRQEMGPWRAIMQVVTPHVIVRTTSSLFGGPYSYDLEFYKIAAKGGWVTVPGQYVNEVWVPEWGYYSVNTAQSNLITTWSIENPWFDGSSRDEMRIRETRGSQVREWIYTHAGDDTHRLWTLTLPEGLGRHEYSADYNAVLGERWSVLRVFNGLNELVHEEGKGEKSYPWGWGTHRETVGSGAQLRATTREFRSAQFPDVTSGAVPVTKIFHPDGTWSRFSYQNSSIQELVTTEDSGWGDVHAESLSGDWRTTTYSYSSVNSQLDDLSVAPTRPRNVTETILNQVVSETDHIYISAGGMFADVVAEHREIRYPSLWASSTDPETQTTITYYHATSPGGLGGDTGEIDRIKLPDGTWILYDYLRNLQTHTRTYTVKQGEVQPNGSGVALLNGTQSVVVRGSVGEILSRSVHWVSSGSASAPVSQVLYSNHDSFGRPQRATYLNGRFRDFSYDCCGLASLTDLDGVQTSYGYDVLKRLTSVTRLGVTRNFGLDPLGRRLVETRVGWPLPTSVTRQQQFDTTGFLIRETNALNGVTTYARSIISNGERTTTTYPDLGTRIEDRDRAGQVSQISGTAVAPVQYEYGVGTIPPFTGQRFVKEIRVNSAPNTSTEWVKTYTDFFGRVSRRVFPDATPTTDADNPHELNSYNYKGQLARTKDADGVLKVYKYNGRGQLQYEALVLDPAAAPLDLSTGDYVINWSVDRVTRREQLVDSATAPWPSGTLAIKSRTYQSYGGDDGETGTLVREDWTSADGLRQRSTVVGQVTDSQTAYLVNGNRSRVQTLPDLSTVSEVFTNGRLASVTRRDSLGTTLSQVDYGYDTHGRLGHSVDLRSGRSTFGYNSADQVSSVQTPVPGTGEGAQTTLTDYNSSLRAWRVTSPDGGVVTNIYFANGLLQKTFGIRTTPVEYTYDLQGRMNSMKTWQDASSVSAPKNALTTWSYKAERGFLESKRYADPASGGAGVNGVDYTYTAGGRIKTRRWARNNAQGSRMETTYVYGFDDGPAQGNPHDNEHGDLVAIQYNDGGLTPDVSFGVDRLGRRETVTRGGITTAIGLSLAGAVEVESYTGGILDGLTVGMAMDAQLRPASLSVANNAQPLGSVVTYGYDEASRVKTVSDGTFQTGYVYENNANWVRTLTFKQNATLRVTTEQRYDFLGRLREVSARLNSSSGLPAVSSSYQYNSANQRERNREADGSYWQYSYDALGQVTSGKKYWSDGTPVAGMQYEYGFDDIGNRKTAKWGGDQAGAGLRSATYTVNRQNQYSQRTVPGSFDVVGMVASGSQTVTVNGATPYRKGGFFRQSVTAANTSVAQWTAVTVAAPGQPGGTNTGNVWVAKTAELYASDEDGNLLNDGRWNYVWDGENRLVRMTARTTVGPQLRLDFEYDWQGRRIGKKVWSNVAGTGQPTLSRAYLYRGWNLVMELDAAAPTKTLLTQYVWGRDLAGGVDGAGLPGQQGQATAGGVGGLVEIRTATATYGVVYDGNGNVMGLVDGSNGTVAARYEYGPFGELIRASGPMAKNNPFRFSTKYQDDETDLVYYGYRFYNASTGRWLGRDPIEEWGGLNLMAFIYNDGLNWVDLLGLDASETLFGQIFQGIYDGLMGEGPNASDPNGYGRMRGEELGGLDPHDNLLRDVFGGAGDLLQGVAEEAANQAVNPVFGKVAKTIKFCKPDKLSMVGKAVKAAKVPKAAKGADAAAALRSKLSALENAQQTAARTRTLPDGRIRYYGAETPARTPGPTRGASYVTEHNPSTGQVRSWMESYDQAGNVTRVHPKMINGQPVNLPHYPPTGKELGQ